MSENWVPFGLTDSEVEDFEVLVPGVPPWLKEPLVNLVHTFLDEGDLYFYSGHRSLDIQLETRIDLGASGDTPYASKATVLSRLRSLSDMELLRVVDYIVSERAGSPTSPPALIVEQILRSARSKWTIGTRSGRVGLVERVAQGVQDSIEGTIRSAGSAGLILARAWAHVHGFQPNDSAGYSDAVRAVEIASISKVQPNNQSATLGSVINQMRAQGDWHLPLREHEHSPSNELLLNSLRTLWHGHRDRHGGADYSDVTHEEARAAVALAATLVEWFDSGAVSQRRSPIDDSDRLR